MLSDVDPAAKIINDIQVKSGVELDPPSRLVSESGPPPEDVSFSPCVRETLEFFNMHRIRNVSVGRFATRLLQLGGGNTVLALEKQGELGDYIEKLRNLQ